MKPTTQRSLSGRVWGFLGVLTLLILLFLPVWPYSVAWGYYPATGFGFIFLLFLVALLLGAFIVSTDHSDRSA